MKIYNKDCFAIVMPEDNEKDNKPMCRALGKIECEGCTFYKKKDSIKDNIFYKDSFKDIDKYYNEVKEYRRKYNITTSDSLDD